ncbi:MAG: hypothetical protein BRD40_03780 [Bacteroidetes bacterium QS_1_65_9]|nr:MAG: hypothetical protein BRD40_03780 [Bacteroidetes bacterium QS_1_65_9]
MVIGHSNASHRSARPPSSPFPLSPFTSMPRTISILGCGWVGLPLGRALAEDGHRVHGATTTPDKQAALEDAGIAPHVLHLTPDVESDRADDFFDADVLVFTVPPPRGVDDRVGFYKKQLRAALDAARAGGVRHVLYTGSTGVYPPRGRVVTEDRGGLRPYRRAPGGPLRTGARPGALSGRQEGAF